MGYSRSSLVKCDPFSRVRLAARVYWQNDGARRSEFDIIPVPLHGQSKLCMCIANPTDPTCAACFGQFDGEDALCILVQRKRASGGQLCGSSLARPARLLIRTSRHPLKGSTRDNISTAACKPRVQAAGLEGGRKKEKKEERGGVR